MAKEVRMKLLIKTENFLNRIQFSGIVIITLYYIFNLGLHNISETEPVYIVRWKPGGGVTLLDPL
jgi:hypothetical protein